VTDESERVSRFELERVHYMQMELRRGILYVSEEFGTAAHLCACGCGSKVRTPLGPTAWSLEETKRGPTLRPSVGNWQKACQSHYWIIRGEVIWSDKWKPEQIAAGRRHEEARRDAYYRHLYRKEAGIFRRFIQWLKKLFG
jgi:hypothetical protein